MSWGGDLLQRGHRYSSNLSDLKKKYILCKYFWGNLQLEVLIHVLGLKEVNKLKNDLMLHLNKHKLDHDNMKHLRSFPTARYQQLSLKWWWFCFVRFVPSHFIFYPSVPGKFRFGQLVASLLTCNDLCCYWLFCVMPTFTAPWGHIFSLSHQKPSIISPKTQWKEALGYVLWTSHRGWLFVC